MSDADNRAGCCSTCGLPILEGERVYVGATQTIHESPWACAQRLFDALDERSADLAAALRVVRAARIARVRRWQADRRLSDYRREVYAHGSAEAAALVAEGAYSDWHAAERAYRAALAAYVRGEGA